MGSRGYWKFFKNWQISGPTSKVCQHQLSTTLNFDQKLWNYTKKEKKNSFQPSLVSFPSPPLLCSWTSLSVHTLIETCKSLWHWMNRQLLAGCPMPLCAQPLNWSAPVFLLFFYPHSLWPDSVWHQQGQYVFLQSLNLIRTAVCWKTTCHSRHQTVSVTLL